MKYSPIETNNNHKQNDCREMKDIRLFSLRQVIEPQKGKEINEIAENQCFPFLAWPVFCKFTNYDRKRCQAYKDDGN
jgi:hypothetical protein